MGEPLSVALPERALLSLASGDSVRVARGLDDADTEREPVLLDVDAALNDCDRDAHADEETEAEDEEDGDAQ